MLRVGLSVCVFIAGLLSGAPLLSPASAADASDVSATMRPGTSLLVFEYPLDPHSATRSRYPVVFLADATVPKDAQQNKLDIGRKTGFQVLEVPAGSYYIRQVTTDFFGFPSAPRPVPKSESELLVIPAGVVAYLGDVRWTIDMGLRLGFSKPSLLALQKKTELHPMPLMLVAFGAEPRLVSWD